MIKELKTRTIETKTAHISLIDDKIIRLEIKDEAHLEYESLQENYQAYFDMLGGAAAPFLIIVNDSAVISTEGRKKFNKKMEKELRRADALVMKSPSTMLMINAQVNFIKPKVPIQAFISEHEGLNWLRSFVD